MLIPISEIMVNPGRREAAPGDVKELADSILEVGLINPIMLSFSKGERVSPKIANNYALGIIQYYADEYQIVYAVHNNTDEVHVHFVMNQVSYKDGYKYTGKKKDYYEFKKYIENIIGTYVILDTRDNKIEEHDLEL